MEFFLEHVLFSSEPQRLVQCSAHRNCPVLVCSIAFITQQSSFHLCGYSEDETLWCCVFFLFVLFFFRVERDLACRPVLLPTLEKIKVNNSWQGVSQKLWFLENLKTFCRKFYWGSRKIGFSYFYLFYLCRVFAVTLDNIHSPFLQQQS